MTACACFSPAIPTCHGALLYAAAALLSRERPILMTHPCPMMVTRRANAVHGSRERPIDETSWAKTEEGGGLQGYHRCGRQAGRQGWGKGRSGKEEDTQGGRQRGGARAGVAGCTATTGEAGRRGRGGGQGMWNEAGSSHVAEGGE